jgi:hypothetical protein
LNNSKYELNDAQEFQFLRSNEEENDIGAVENIRWRNEIATRKGNESTVPEAEKNTLTLTN